MKHTHVERRALALVVALVGLATTGMGANAQRHRRHLLNRGYVAHQVPTYPIYGGYSRFTGRDPDYLGPLGLSEQTATGGPVGGSRLGTGGR